MKRTIYDMRILILLITVWAIVSIHFIADINKDRMLLPQQAKYLLIWNSDNLTITEESTSYTADYKPPYLTPFFFEKIPINQADHKLLQTIPGIGPHLAACIINTRNSHGFFHSPSDLLKVSGIGEKRKEKLKSCLNFN